MSNDTLLAVPFFTFMGLILERSGMAEDLLDTIGQLFGPMRGGLAYAVIFVGALLAATTGVVAASVISMGLISLPIMLRYGYDRRLASGVIAASGTLAQIIPPSLVLIIMADQLGTVGRRHVRGRVHSRASCSPACTRSTCSASRIVQAALGAGAAAGSAHAARAGRQRAARRSLLVLFVVVGRRRGRVRQAAYSPPDAPLDELLVVSTCVGVGVAFFAAVINRMLKLGLLSRIAERVDLRADPAARADLPRARHDLPRRRDADRRRRDGRDRRADHGARAPPPDAASCCSQAMDTTAKLSTLRRVHPGRRARVQPDVLRRQRPRLGRAPADEPARRRSSAS